MGKDRTYPVIKARLTWVQLDQILGEPEFDLNEETIASPLSCSLAPGKVTYKIYSKWLEPWGLYSAHVCLHSDGVCFSGSLNVDQDWEFAQELYQKVKTVLDKYRDNKGVGVNNVSHNQG